MQQWWIAIVPVVLGAAGYLVRRWFERRRQAEGLKRKLQALALHQGLKREGISLQQLAQLEREAAN